MRRFIRRILQARRSRQYHEKWERIMAGLAVRDHATEKPNPEISTQRQVAPVYIDSVNWGIEP